LVLTLARLRNNEKGRQFQFPGRQKGGGFRKQSYPALFSIFFISLNNAVSTLAERRSPRATRLTYEGSIPSWRATRL
jgi:hypothetical protein